MFTKTIVIGREHQQSYKLKKQTYKNNIKN